MKGIILLTLYILAISEFPPYVEKECYKQTIESSSMMHRMKCPGVYSE